MTERIGIPFGVEISTQDVLYLKEVYSKSEGEQEKILPMQPSPDYFDLLFLFFPRAIMMMMIRGLTSHSTLYRSFLGRFLQAR